MKWMAILNAKVIRLLYRKSVLVPSLVILSIGVLVQAVFVFTIGGREIVPLSKAPLSDLKLDNVAIIGALLFAPIVETIVFFSFVHFLFGKIRKRQSVLLFAVAGTILFSLSHWYSLDYMIAVALFSYLLFLYYAILRRQKRNGFLPICAIHFLRNAVAVVGIVVMK